MISITLPSIYPTSCERTLQNIADTTHSPYEIILVSPFPPPLYLGGRVIWVKETQPRGNVPAHAAAYPVASGEFILGWSDDHLLVDSWDREVLSCYARRSPHTSQLLVGLLYQDTGHIGTVWGMYYPYFPFAKRSDLEKVGGWYDPGYSIGFADCDLGLRYWQHGGRAEWTNVGLVTPHKDHDRERIGILPSDMKRFVDIWAPLYGNGWDSTTLRGFNIDLVPEDYSILTDGHTVCHPSPDFREKVWDGGWRPSC